MIPVCYGGHDKPSHEADLTGNHHYFASQKTGGVQIAIYCRYTLTNMDKYLILQNTSTISLTAISSFV